MPMGVGGATADRGDDRTVRCVSLRSPQRFAQQDKNLRLTPYISCVEAARDGSVGGAFDDGAAVGEEGHFVGVVPEFQDEVVVADPAVGLETAVHFGEVDGALAFMDLHGIPATKGDVRTAFAGEMDEVAVAAGAAVGTRLGGGDLGVLVGPQVET